MGAAFFMLFGIVTYAMQRGKRDFTSTSQVVATNYDVVVSFEAAHEARRLLQQLPMTGRTPGGRAARGYSQRDYQHQPYQPGQQGPQASPASRARPRSAPRAGTTPTASGLPNPADSRPDGSPANQQPGNQPAGTGSRRSRQGQPADCRAASRPRKARHGQRVRYPDLPDGRPQYGVRVTDAPKQEPRPGRLAALARRTQKASARSRSGRRPYLVSAARGSAPRGSARRYGVWPSASW